MQIARSFSLIMADLPTLAQVHQIDLLSLNKFDQKYILSIEVKEPSFFVILS